MPVTSNYWWPQGGADPEGFSGSLPDPECEKAAADDGPMGTLGLHPDFSHICVYDYSSFFALVRPEEQIKFHSDGNFRLSPGTEIYGSFSYSEQESSRGNSLYPDVRYVIVPERHFGLQLDAARRGFDPVPYQALQRILGGTVESTEEDRPISTVSTTRRENMRALIGLQSDFTVAGQSWLLDSDLIYSRNQLDLNWPVDTLTSRMDLAFAAWADRTATRRPAYPVPAIWARAGVTITTAFRPAFMTRSQARAGIPRILPPGPLILVSA